MSSALSVPSSEGLPRQSPVQYNDSGESQMSMGDIVLPSHRSVLVEMESAIFDLVVMGEICASVKSKGPGDDVTGDVSGGGSPITGTEDTPILGV